VDDKISFICVRYFSRNHYFETILIHFFSKSSIAQCAAAICLCMFDLQINRPASMRKEGIQTRKRRPKGPKLPSNGWCLTRQPIFFLTFKRNSRTENHVQLQHDCPSVLSRCRVFRSLSRDNHAISVLSPRRSNADDLQYQT